MSYNKREILIIEDEPDISELLEFNFQQSGYNTLFANDGLKGIKFARKYLPYLILLDLMMPGIHVLDVCRVLNKDNTTNHIMIIILTALGQEEDIVRGLESGADDYLTKPFTIPILIARINSVLRRNTKSDQQNEFFSIGGITISDRKREVSIDGDKILNLTFTEF